MEDRTKLTELHVEDRTKLTELHVEDRTKLTRSGFHPTKVPMTLVRRSPGLREAEGSIPGVPCHGFPVINSVHTRLFPVFTRDEAIPLKQNNETKRRTFEIWFAHKEIMN